MRVSAVARAGVVVSMFCALSCSNQTSTAVAMQPGISVPSDPAAVGYLNLAKRHPDGAEGPVEFSTGLATEPALERLDQMKDFLASFEALTLRARKRLSAADLEAAGNTSWEAQTLGFHNIPLVVEGTLLKQDYQLKQVEYELAQLRYVRGDVASEDVDRARDAYAAATKRFQTFWDTTRPID